MKDCWFFDNFNGVSDEVFDNVVGFFDFPLDDDGDDVVEEDWDAQFKKLEEPSLGVFSVSSSGLCGKTKNENPKHGRNFPASAAMTFNGKTIPKDAHRFQTYSPVSVFERGSSSPVENCHFDLPVIPVKRPRSKRRRLSSISLLFSNPFISYSPASKSDLRTKPAGKKKLARKDLSVLPNRSERKISSAQESDDTRKCMHCEVTTTPQWREGPMGPKTLCNACGVRYRSGRLFPEYRPAVSPTFVPSLHSNSHKKVIEMRSGAAKKTISDSSILAFSPNLPGNPL